MSCYVCRYIHSHCCHVFSFGVLPFDFIYKYMYMTRVSEKFLVGEIKVPCKSVLFYICITRESNPLSIYDLSPYDF